MNDYTSYFLNSPSSAVPLDTLEIEHPNFTRIYRLVRNAKDGIEATLETAAVVTFEYRPIRIRPAGSSDDLEQVIQVDLGDLGEIIPIEVDEISSANGFGIKPTVKYRIYRSDDLSAPMLGPVLLEIGAFSFTHEGSSFEAKAPSLDVNRTGELYRVARFPMLRGFR